MTGKLARTVLKLGARVIKCPGDSSIPCKVILLYDTKLYTML